MKNLLLGFLLGILVATAAGVWAQSGSFFSPDDSGTYTILKNPDGSSGTLYRPGGGALSIYQDSAGRSGSIYTYPGTGSGSFSFGGVTEKKPC